jgi:hypothetical protein
VGFSHQYADKREVVSGQQNTSISTTTITDILDAATKSMPRIVNFINIHNPDTAAATITLYYYDNGTRYIIFKGTWAAGTTATFTSDTGKFVDSTGSVLIGAGTAAAGGATAYRYYRLYITDNNGNVVASSIGRWWLYRDLAATDKINTQALRDDLTHTYDSDPFSGANPPESVAVDDYTDIYEWYVENNDVWPIWISIDLGSGNEEGVLAYKLMAQRVINPGTRQPSSWEFQGSNDNTNWTTLHTASNETAWTPLEFRTYTP